jgi:signal transduction histidine kinase/ligand-binding sensor domain-containing protein/DNA-binding response OmpR family regulator
MKKREIFILALLLLRAYAMPLLAQNGFASRYTFGTLTVDNGLPINFIDDIYKDSHNFIWISTQGGGLSRFDGYEFVTFNVSSQPIRLRSNFVRKVCEDNFSRLWIASDYGIDIIDLKTLESTRPSTSDKALTSILSQTPSTIFKDSRGRLWIVVANQLSRIDFNEKGDIRQLSSTNAPNTSQSDIFTTISEIKNEIWVGKNGVVQRVSERKDGSLVCNPVSINLKFGNNLFISSIIEKNNTAWIGTENGLYKYNIQSQGIERYSYNAANPSSISQDMITSLEMTNDGILVIGTLKGINFYDLETNSFERVSHNSKGYAINSDFVNCLLSDGNNLWVGTEAGGINKLTLKRLAINNYIHNNEDATSLSPNPVNAILEDHRGDLWIGTVEGGLNQQPKNQKGFIHYRAGKGSITHNSVSALEEDRNGNLWIGTWGGSISVLNLNKLPKKVFTYIPPELDYIALLKYDPVNHGMWIGTNRNIFYYDMLTNSIKKPLDTNLTRGIMGVLGCVIDRKNQLWIGTSRGLLIVDLKSFNPQKFTCKSKYLQLPKNELSELFAKNITSISQSRDNTIWLSSNGYGICRLIFQDNRYQARTYTSEQGLINNATFSMKEDEKGLIWISTGNGISCLNPHTEHFINYSKNDGLVNEQFYWNAGYISPTTQKIYFGSIGGLTEIDGDSKRLKNEQMKVHFTKLQVLNQTVYAKESYTEQDISFARQVNLHENDKSFSIEFSALDYDNPSTINYSYRLIGFDNKWINVSADRRFVSYTNLSPGKYRLQIRCMNPSGEWSGNISEMEIVIHPYFYKTVWFISLAILFLIACIVQFYRWRVGEFKKQREILHRKVEERTQKLAHQTILLEEQAEELKLQNQKLLQQNEKISRQRKQLIVMSKKVQEAMADRISFFTNITHEFRTPITLIVGPIERALKLSTNPKVIEQLQFVARNSKNLLSLVNQLMDFRKVESDNIRIETSVGNLTSFIDETLVPFESFANERGINIRKLYRIAHPQALFDSEALRKLITNLLSNAIKFTPDRGSVTLYAASAYSSKEQKDKLYICISDTGIGIRDEDINVIFDKFYQSKGDHKYPVYGQSGTGIGLYLSKKIVELMHGILYARNNPNRGASFRVILPMEYQAQLPGMINPKGVFSEMPTLSVEEEQSTDKRLSILVVEDNNDMRKYIASILIGKYEIAEAENGKEALDILKTKSIDFIISDLMMPVMDGMELSKKVKADFSISHIPFLMLTAKTETQTRIKSYKMGVDEFLSKPFDEELLLARIQNILETRHNYQLRFSLRMNISELNIEKESNDEKFLKKAIQAVKENYQNPAYELSDFMQEMGMSKTLIHRKMQTLMGQSPGLFIRNYRLSVAREILSIEKNDLTIAEVAYEVGFNDPKYFTRCFTKHYGIAPSSFSKDHSKNEPRKKGI